MQTAAWHHPGTEVEGSQPGKGTYLYPTSRGKELPPQNGAQVRGTLRFPRTRLAPKASGRQVEGVRVEGCTYRTLGVGKVNLQVAHGLDNGHDGLDGVAVDNRTILPTFFL